MSAAAAPASMQNTVTAHHNMTVYQVKLAVQERDGYRLQDFNLLLQPGSGGGGSQQQPLILSNGLTLRELGIHAGNPRPLSIDLKDSFAPAAGAPPPPSSASKFGFDFSTVPPYEVFELPVGAFVRGSVGVGLGVGVGVGAGLGVGGNVGGGADDQRNKAAGDSPSLPTRGGSSTGGGGGERPSSAARQQQQLLLQQQQQGSGIGGGGGSGVGGRKRGGSAAGMMVSGVALTGGSSMRASGDAASVVSSFSSVAASPTPLTMMLQAGQLQQALAARQLQQQLQVQLRGAAAGLDSGVVEGATLDGYRLLQGCCVELPEDAIEGKLVSQVGDASVRQRNQQSIREELN